MRFVFDIVEPSDRKLGPSWCATGSGHRYVGPTGTEHEWRGFHVEVLAAGPNAHDRNDCFVLEGNGEEVKRLLRSMLSVVEGVERFHRDRFDKRQGDK